MNRPVDLPETVETVLLDAGGVLLDLDVAYLRRLLVSRGHAVEEPELRRGEVLARASIQARIRESHRQNDVWRDYFHLQLRHAGVPPEGHGEIIDVLWKAHHRIGLWTVTPDGALETVRRLRHHGLRLGVVSNAEGRVEQDLVAAGYDGLFATVVDSHLVGVEKPDPRIFGIALERLSADADTTVFVGDLPSVDVAGARAAGIAPLLLDPLDLHADEPVARLRSIRELPARLGLPDG